MKTLYKKISTEEMWNNIRLGECKIVEFNGITLTTSIHTDKIGRDTHNHMLGVSGHTMAVGMENTCDDKLNVAIVLNASYRNEPDEEIIEYICKKHNIQLVVLDDNGSTKYLKFDNTNIIEYLMEDIYEMDINLCDLLVDSNQPSDGSLDISPTDCLAKSMVAFLDKENATIRLLGMYSNDNIELAIINEYGTKKEAIKQLIKKCQENGFYIS